MRNVANISIVENRSVLTAPSGVRWDVWVQKYFETQNYLRVRQGSAFLTFGQLVKFPSCYVFDLFIIAYAEDVEAAENLAPQLDGECERIRRALLQGRSLFQGISVQKHHFITLHKPCIRHSYEKNGMPVGFSIRPLILVREGELWDYYSGQTRRVDILSLDKEGLNIYLTRHRESLNSRRPDLLNQSKYLYWRISNSLIDHGHIPLIALWVIYFFCTIFQVSSPLTLGNMIALTSLLYGGFVAFNYYSYLTFQKRRVRELREVDLHQVSPAQSQYHRSSPYQEEIVVVEESPTHELASPGETQDNVPAFVDLTPPPAEVAPPRNQAGRRDIARYFKSRIHTKIGKIVCLHNTKMMMEYGGFLLRNVLIWLVWGDQADIQCRDPIRQLLHKAMQLRPDMPRFEELRFWVTKIETRTPFTLDELQPFKKFLLYYLYDLQLLPPHLVQTVEKGNQRSIEIPSFKLDPSSTGGVISSEIKDQLEDLSAIVENSEKVVLCDSETQHNSPPPTPPNFETATLPVSVHLDLAGLPAGFLRKIRNEERNGIYCLLIIEEDSPSNQEIKIQFDAATKDLDVSARNYMSIETVDDPNLKMKLKNTVLPVIVIGCGKNEQIIPYGKKGDDARLFAVVDSFKVPPCNITLREKVPSEEKGSNCISIPPPPLPPQISFQNEDNSIMEQSLKNIQKGSILLDGSNLVFVIADVKKDKVARLSCIFDVLKELESWGITRNQLVVYFDANIEYKLKDPGEKRKLKELLKDDMFRQAPAGMQADTSLIRVAEKLQRRFIVFSNDMFRGKPKWFRSHRIGVGYDPGVGIYLGVDTLETLLDTYHGKNAQRK